MSDYQFFFLAGCILAIDSRRSYKWFAFACIILSVICGLVALGHEAMYRHQYEVERATTTSTYYQPN